MKRRDFIRTSALSAATLATAVPALSQPLNTIARNLPFKTMPIGLGMFTLFGVIEKDVPGTLKKVKEIGYSELESAFSMKGGYYGLTAKEFAKLTKETGLAWRSHHVLGNPFNPPPGAKLPAGFENMPKPKDLTNNAQELVDDVASGGIKYIVCASIDISSGDNVKKAIETLNKADELAKKAGLTLCYHNHDKEFATVDGIVPYDLFLSQLNKSVQFEIDLAWVSKAKVDPVELFKKNPGRFPMWHVKDFNADYTTLEPVGKGVIDFKRIFAASETAGLKHTFVEHDMPKDAFASITDSITYLKTILK
jgi:sugar phosphate isomerase/epimerase